MVIGVLGIWGDVLDNNITADEFDALASEYESNRLATWYKAHADFIFESLSLKPGNTVLDVGCGTGYLLRRIGRAYPEVSGIGIDLSPKMIEAARKKAAEENLTNLMFVHADWERPTEKVQMLLKAHPVSHAICANAFHYFADTQKALASMESALVPGGELVLFERAKEGSWLTDIWGLVHRFLIKDNVRFYDTPSVLQMLKRVGFLDAKVNLRIQKYFWIESRTQTGRPSAPRAE